MHQLCPHSQHDSALAFYCPKCLQQEVSDLKTRVIEQEEKIQELEKELEERGNVRD